MAGSATRLCHTALPLLFIQLVHGTESLKGADGPAFTSRLLSCRHSEMDSLSPAPRRSGKSQMAEPGPFPRACEAQKSGQSWHRRPPFLTRSPLAEGSKAPALLEVELDHVGRGRRLAEGVEVPGRSVLWPGPKPDVSAIGQKHRGTLRASSGVLGQFEGGQRPQGVRTGFLGSKAGT